MCATHELVASRAVLSTFAPLSVVAARHCCTAVLSMPTRARDLTTAVKMFAASCRTTASSGGGATAAADDDASSEAGATLPPPPNTEPWPEKNGSMAIGAT